MNWASRSANNILPYSKNKKNLSAALSEWTYTGEMHDLEKPTETCELCNHPGIRYQFNIRNIHNHNELLVGSECINKFEIKAYDNEGSLLSKTESRKKVNRDRRYLITESTKKRLINSLVSLTNKDNNFNIKSFIDYVQDRGAFTPSQLSTLIWRLDEHSIIYNPVDFKLIMQRDREKAQLKSMPEWKIGKLWPSLSPNQKKWVLRNTEYKPQ